MNPGKLDDLGALELIFTPSFNLLELEARILRHGSLEELALTDRPLRALRQVQAGLLRLLPRAQALLPSAQQEPGHRRADRGAALRRAARARGRLRAAAQSRGGRRPLHHLPQMPQALPGGHRHRRGLGPRARDPRGPRVQAHGAGHPRDARLPRERLAGRSTRSSARWCSARAARPSGSWRAPLRPLQGAAGARARLALRRRRCRRPTRSGCATCCPAASRTRRCVFEPDGRGAHDRLLLPRLRLGAALRLGRDRRAAPAARARRARGAAAAVPLLRLPGQRQRRTEMHGRIACATRSSSPRSARCSATSSSTRWPSPAAPAARRSTRWRSARSSAARSWTRRGWRSSCGAPVAIDGDFLYHAPCHDSLDGRGAALLARRAPRRRGAALLLRGRDPRALARRTSPTRCCTESARRSRQPRAGRPGAAVLLTNCPSCLPGLGRNRDLGVEPRHIAVELARALSGPGWLDRLRERAGAAQAVRF